ncbi:uncharacterized protein LOC111277294 isoform X2 [Durio zibethinus]|uniref:Uncharacterized protein LOC111277294 isoform X2 n=1 Tax=Durio zibethinus TaxID=66656 RepID=A0A6P5WUQ0_DURZI|nr:uncharacterized protein LOC111277294 isoform X2 [Durio zibethinus]
MPSLRKSKVTLLKPILKILQFLLGKHSNKLFKKKMTRLVELLIPQLQFPDGEGVQAEFWELSRIFLDTLKEGTRCQIMEGVL